MGGLGVVVGGGKVGGWVGSFTWESVRGSVTSRRRGSRNCLVIWLVKVPGVKRPAMDCAPVYWANCWGEDGGWVGELGRNGWVGGWAGDGP